MEDQALKVHVDEKYRCIMYDNQNKERRFIFKGGKEVRHRFDFCFVCISEGGRE